MSEKLDWNKIIPLVLKGDRSATTELIEITQESLFVFCFHLSKNKQLAEDLTHDTYLKALTCLHQLKEPGAFMGWLKAIARSLYLDYIKSAAQSRTHVPLDEALDLQGPSRLTAEQLSALEVLQTLSEEDRTILILIDIQEVSYSEASQVLAIPEGTVKSRLARAREKFSKKYNGTN